MLNFGRVTNNENSVSVYQLRLARKGIAMKRLMAFPHAKTGTCSSENQGDFESEITLDEWIFLHGFMGKNSCSFNIVHLKKQNELVVSTHLNNGNLPQGVKIKDIWNHHLEKESPFWEAENFRYLQVKKTLFNFMSFSHTMMDKTSISDSY